ncbi:peroxidase 40 precursor [Decorospora gaudefroyi]|uniref:Peroxidase n=1 Tax=Decorospora gaudefroyi TaxID=184978 RepID=A0A6A5KB26_9PLEO|nr:peroxidase 40 precursor [Decorospora gaudefroyi]
MYIRNMLLSGLAAASTAQAYANYTIREEDFPAPTPAPAPTTPKRTLSRIFGLVGDLLGINKDNDTPACPAIWTEISTTLTEQFLADGQCTDAARAAIRASFHDCFNGACDGSLILANECSNAENKGLERLCGNLANLATQTKVGVADLIQFAAAHAIKTCPGGPTVPVKIGRKDSSTAGAVGVLPGPNERGGDLVRLFASKGFTPTDLAALIGAHTTAKQRQADPSRAGASFDSTPGVWDNKFYSETKSGNKAPFTLQSDRNLAQNPLTAIPFSAFALSKARWDEAFVGAMVKMGLLGVREQGLVDCTGALPGGAGRKREVRGGDVFDRLGW